MGVAQPVNSSDHVVFGHAGMVSEQGPDLVVERLDRVGGPFSGGVEVQEMKKDALAGQAGQALVDPAVSSVGVPPGPPGSALPDGHVFGPGTGFEEVLVGGVAFHKEFGPDRRVFLTRYLE